MKWQIFNSSIFQKCSDSQFLNALLRSRAQSNRVVAGTASCCRLICCTGILFPTVSPLQPFTLLFCKNNKLHLFFPDLLCLCLFSYIKSWFFDDIGILARLIVSGSRNYLFLVAFFLVSTPCSRSICFGSKKLENDDNNWFRLQNSWWWKQRYRLFCNAARPTAHVTLQMLPEVVDWELQEKLLMVFITIQHNNSV